MIERLYSQVRMSIKHEESRLSEALLATDRQAVNVKFVFRSRVSPFSFCLKRYIHFLYLKNQI